MHLIALAWMYVVTMAALVEAFSPHGSVLGAVLTWLGWGALPLAIVLFIVGTPARKRARARAEAARAADAAPRADGSAAGSAAPDGRGHAAGAAVAPEREET